MRNVGSFHSNLACRRLETRLNEPHFARKFALNGFHITKIHIEVRAKTHRDLAADSCFNFRSRLITVRHYEYLQMIEAIL